MREIVMVGKSKKFPRNAMWQRIITIENYPQTIKFVKKVNVSRLHAGTTFTDVTTLLWIPLPIHHIITEIKEKEKIRFFLPLPAGGKMWHTFLFSQKNREAIMRAEIRFDLGNWVMNKTLGYILEKRWEDLLMNAFPEIEEKKRIR